MIAEIKDERQNFGQVFTTADTETFNQYFSKDEIVTERSIPIDFNISAELIWDISVRLSHLLKYWLKVYVSALVKTIPKLQVLTSILALIILIHSAALST